MTTKEEVLRLAEAAGVDLRLIAGEIRIHSRITGRWIVITKLIELAKAQSAEDAIRRSLYCSTGVFNDDAVKETLEFIFEADVDEAIRNRERKE